MASSERQRDDIPLVDKAADASGGGGAAGDAAAEPRGCAARWWPWRDAATRAETREWVGIAAPSTLQLFCRLGMALTDLALLGHLSTDALAAASLANVWLIVSSTWILDAISGALNTTCSQAYGARNMSLVGIWLQCALVVCTSLCLPIAAAWWFADDVLVAAGFPADTSALGAKFARYSLIGLLPQAWYVCLASYFRAQGVIAPQLVVNAVMLVLNFLLGYSFIWGIGGFGGWGFVGSPLATSVSRWLGCIGFWLYAFVWRKMHVETWGGWSTEALSGHRIKEFVYRQGLPLAIGRALEEFQLQLVNYLAARLGSVSLAVNATLFETFFVLTSVMYGYTTATSVRIGQHVGAGRIHLAKRVVRISLFFSGITGLVISMVLVFGRYYIGKVFSDDPHVINMTAIVIIPVAAGYGLLCFFYVSMAMLEGTARNGVIAVSFLVGAWLVAVPLALVFSFVLKKDLLWLWIAMVCGYAVVTLIAGIAAYRTDWEACVAAAAARSAAKEKDAAADAVGDAAERSPLLRQRKPKAETCNV